MGDRANVYIQDSYSEGVGVYLYSHWGGEAFQQRALDVLNSDVARDRWNDSAYLGRILIQGLLIDKPFNSTGYGVSAAMPDNSYPILVLDTLNQRAALVMEGRENERLTTEGVTFDQACGGVGLESL